MSNPSPTLGHVHLQVSDLDRSIAFYSHILGLELQLRYGEQAAFLSFAGYHHHLGLNTWHSANARRAPKGHPGLYHSAWLYPDRPSLAATLKRALDTGVVIDGQADHGVSEAVYFSDPDGNGIEIYRDKPVTQWPYDAKGKLNMVNAPLDLDALLAEVP